MTSALLRRFLDCEAGPSTILHPAPQGGSPDQRGGRARWTLRRPTLSKYAASSWDIAPIAASLCRFEKPKMDLSQIRKKIAEAHCCGSCRIGRARSVRACPKNHGCRSWQDRGREPV
jgi:hypothetical protein